MKFSASSLAIICLPTFGLGAQYSGTITITNEAPTDGTLITPVWVGIHDGTFDTYTLNEPASAALERIAEDGDAGPLVADFAKGSPGRLFDDVVNAGVGPIAPGVTKSVSFTIDVEPGTSWYFSYASMVIPSNDAFVANGNPTAYTLLDGDGPNPLDFYVYGSQVRDAGTEENDEIPMNTAALGQSAPNTGTPTMDGVVTTHPGFLPGGNILNEIPNGDFTADGYKVARIRVTIGPGVGAGGDPHFLRWDGRYYDFMGACDLVLVNAPRFTESTALSINVRTKIRYNYSFIESAVVKLGEEKLLVSSFGEYALNGVESADPEEMSIAGFPITYSNPSEKVHNFDIQLNDQESISLSTFNDMVSIKLNSASRERFEGALGMLGSFDQNGKMVGRDGETVIEDPVDMAAEWQVKQDEPMLFPTAVAPQHPAKCVMPNERLMETRTRRLGASLAYEVAQKACANWHEDIREACIHDVMATGDLEFAAAGSF